MLFEQDLLREIRSLKNMFSLTSVQAYSFMLNIIRRQRHRTNLKKLERYETERDIYEQFRSTVQVQILVIADPFHFGFQTDIGNRKCIMGHTMSWSHEESKA